MKKSRFTAEQIVGILHEVVQGTTAKTVKRKHGVTEQTVYPWKRVNGDLQGSEAKRLRQLEEENRRLKRIVAEQAMDIVALKDVAGGAGDGGTTAARGHPVRAPALRTSRGAGVAPTTAP